MQRMIFLNLPVHDLSAATAFYEAIGCTRNPQFSDARASCMVWSDTIVFQLLQRDYFATFAPHRIADSRDATAFLIALSCASRAAVDEVVALAAAHGGAADLRAPQDYGFMYSRCFSDPDGHIFEPMWMDPDAASGG